MSLFLHCDIVIFDDCIDVVRKVDDTEDHCS
nr:MAG TPA: hypothetical protein [Caudoviricetes sp.]